ncbi:hypothetical protein BDF14DRAFT_981296 [Spinellus fusiger]|nr:hypothetical protein BDF14DRAFT_981296 [Spinellus fusiger]
MLTEKELFISMDAMPNHVEKYFEWMNHSISKESKVNPKQDKIPCIEILNATKNIPETPKLQTLARPSLERQNYPVISSDYIPNRPTSLSSYSLQEKASSYEDKIYMYLDSCQNMSTENMNELSMALEMYSVLNADQFSETISLNSTLNTGLLKDWSLQENQIEPPPCPPSTPVHPEIYPVTELRRGSNLAIPSVSDQWSEATNTVKDSNIYLNNSTTTEMGFPGNEQPLVSRHTPNTTAHKANSAFMHLSNTHPHLSYYSLASAKNSTKTNSLLPESVYPSQHPSCTFDKELGIAIEDNKQKRHSSDIYTINIPPYVSPSLSSSLSTSPLSYDHPSTPYLFQGLSCDQECPPTSIFNATTNVANTSANTRSHIHLLFEPQKDTTWTSTSQNSIFYSWHT